MTLDLPILVFSNGDGVFDAPADEAARQAAKALKRLSGRTVPLVLCSSKTRAEIEAVQQALEIRHPFVCENGAAAFVPVGYFPFDVPGARNVAGYHAIELGRPHAEVVERLRRTAARQNVGIVGFSDMSVGEVARDCRLSLLQARLAKLREYGERFRVRDPSPAAPERLLRALENAHLRCLAGERYHDVGAAVDTGLAVSLLTTLYKRALGSVITVGSSEATARFSNRHPGATQGVPPGGTALLRWAESIVEGVETLRERESHLAR